MHQNSEAAVWRCSAEKVFLEISQNSQESTPGNFIKKETLAHVFPVNFVKFLKGRIHCEIFLSEHLMKY